MVSTITFTALPQPSQTHELTFVLWGARQTTAAAPTSIEELKQLLKDDTKIQVAGIDVDGILRGKIMMKVRPHYSDNAVVSRARTLYAHARALLQDKFLAAAKGGFGFCSVVFGWDMHDAP